MAQARQTPAEGPRGAGAPGTALRRAGVLAAGVLAAGLQLLASPCGAQTRGPEPAAPPTARVQAIDDASAEAFSHLRPDLPEAERAEALRGRSLFRRAWTAGPRQEGEGAAEGRGLGPLYNRLSCIACHPGNGRGQPPAGPDERLREMLVRLSLPGPGPHGGPRPHPAYGDQLNEEGVHGVPGEGRVRLQWRPVTHRLADGTRTLLRRPVLAFDELAYGPLHGVLLSPRVGPAVFGMGLLEDVPEEALRALAQRRDADGVQGRLNRVWDPVARRMAIGRFGWKANTASLAAQVVQAAQGDLGLSSHVLPGGGCAPRQTACAALARAEGIDLEPAEVAAMARYLAALLPPAARTAAAAAPTPAASAGDATVARGRQLFAQVRCSACHVPSLPQPAGRPPIAPYTDLLLHDLGPGLADGRPDFRASGRHWRTAPLWGVGLVPTVNEHALYLHDGRARGLREAVLWHGGEATRSRRRFERLSAEDQAALLAFVAAL